MSEKKRFRIECWWHTGGSYDVIAETLDEAVEMAKNMPFLPANKYYIDDSFTIDYDGLKEVRDDQD